MKTLYIVPSALLAAAIALGAPTASADVSAKSLEVTFAYNHANSAEQIYAELQQAAHKACTGKMRASLPFVGPSLTAKRQMHDCMSNVVEAGIAKIGRSDLVALHEGTGRNRRA